MRSKYIGSAMLALCCLVWEIRSQTPRAAQELFERASKRHLKGDIDGAIEDFTRAIDLSSRIGVYPRGGNGGGESRAEAGNLVSNFSEIRVVDPFTARIYASRGLMRYLKRDYDGALNDCNRAISINPRLAEAYNYRGVVRLVKDDFDGAKKDFDRTIEIDPRHTEAYNNRGNVHMGKRDFEKALADYDRAIKLNARIPMIFYNRGLTRRETGDRDGSFSDFNKVVELHPKMALGYYGRGVILCDKGQLDRAMIEYNRAIDLDPNLGLAFGNRGLILLRQGKAECGTRNAECGMKIDFGFWILDFGLKAEFGPSNSKSKIQNPKSIFIPHSNKFFPLPVSKTVVIAV